VRPLTLTGPGPTLRVVAGAAPYPDRAARPLHSWAARPPDSSGSEDDPDATPAMTHPPVALVVDDDGAVRSVLAALLGYLGFGVVTASSGEEDVAEYRRDPGRFAFVLCDLHMPGLDGPGTLDELRRVNPGVRVFLMSGSSGGPAPELYVRGAAGFLPKPVTLQALARLLDGLIPGHPG